MVYRNYLEDIDLKSVYSGIAGLALFSHPFAKLFTIIWLEPVYMKIRI